MTADTITLLANLAFDPAAQEGEAIAAFKKLRENGYKPTEASKTTEVATASWSVGLGARMFDVFLLELFEYRSEPYFVITYPTGIRKNLLDKWNITLTVTLPNQTELARFTRFIEDVFEQLKKP